MCPGLHAPKARKTRTTLPETKPRSLLRTSQISESWHDELAVAAAAGMVHTEPPSFMTVTAELDSIADAGWHAFREDVMNQDRRAFLKSAGSV